MRRILAGGGGRGMRGDGRWLAVKMCNSKWDLNHVPGLISDQNPDWDLNP